MLETLFALGRVCWRKGVTAGSWELGDKPGGACELCKNNDVIVGPTFGRELEGLLISQSLYWISPP